MKRTLMALMLLATPALAQTKPAQDKPAQTTPGQTTPGQTTPPQTKPGQDKPALFPTRDVDITYRVPVPGGTDASLLQRLRWNAAARRQRVDLPTSGNWMVLDFAAHRMQLVRDDTHQILDLPSPQTTDLPGAGVSFTRLGPARVDNLACTEWRTVDIRGMETVACYTDDGVLLRARAADRILMVAVDVTFAPQGEGVFTPPAGYTHEPAHR